ncbi:MAG: zinc-binding dehydrogenase [Nitrospirae bacterium]|nr:zinc-binding dehydrogenase [Nitrospirota bacterium]
MKACVLIEPGRLECRDIEKPMPGAGEALVRVRAALTCGTDLKTFRRGHPMIPLPAVLGHEYSGVIEAVGPGVDGFKPGHAVMGVHSGPCGQCFFCARNQPQLCETIMDSKALGSFAEFMLLPEVVVKNNLFHKPDSVSFEHAALLEPLACAVHGVRSAMNGDGKIPAVHGVRSAMNGVGTTTAVHGVKSARSALEKVLVIGAGPIGLLHLVLLKRMGARVIVSGRGKKRLDAALECGADHVIDAAVSDVRREALALTNERGADAVIECTGRPEVWEESVWLARRGGTVVLFGGCPAGTRVGFDAGRIHYDEITLKGVFHFSPGDVREARDIIIDGGIPFGAFISGEYPLSELSIALERLLRGDGVKFCIKP